VGNFRREAPIAIVMSLPPQENCVTATGQKLEQKFGTEGIKPMGRPSLIVSWLMRLVAAVERLNLRNSLVGNPPIYDNAVFPWVTSIESEWHLIRQELDKVLVRKDELPGFHEISTDVATTSQARLVRRPGDFDGDGARTPVVPEGSVTGLRPHGDRHGPA